MRCVSVVSLGKQKQWKNRLTSSVRSSSMRLAKAKQRGMDACFRCTASVCIKCEVPLHAPCKNETHKWKRFNLLSHVRSQAKVDGRVLQARLVCHRTVSKGLGIS